MVRRAGCEDTQTDRGMIVITRIMVWLVSGRSSAASVMMRMGKVNWEAASFCIWVLILINSLELRVANKIWSLSISLFVCYNRSGLVGCIRIWWYNLRIVCRGSSCLLTPSDYPHSAHIGSIFPRLLSLTYSLSRLSLIHPPAAPMGVCTIMYIWHLLNFWDFRPTSSPLSTF